jgi:hypothetical protein
LRHLSVACQLVGSRRCGDQQGHSSRSTQQKRQPRSRLIVAPVQVVQHEERRLTDGNDRANEPFKESVSLPSVDHRPGCTDGSASGLSRFAASVSPRRTGNESVYFHSPDLVEAWQRSLNAWMAQPISNWLESYCPCHAETPRSGNDDAVLTCLLRHVIDQPALAHAGIAHDDEQTGPTLDDSSSSIR